MRGLYLPYGYPTRRTFLKCLNFVKDRIDFIEFGIAFSDPIADGPIIAAAQGKIVKRKIGMSSFLKDVRKLKNLPIKKYIMTYSNIVYGYGVKQFSKDFSPFIHGIILADLPNRMHDYFYKLGFAITLIPFITPESRSVDIRKLKNTRADFIYAIGVRGITGSRDNASTNDIRSKINELKKIRYKKVILGFGIKNKKDITRAYTIADGFVMGTEAVRHMHDYRVFKRFIDKNYPVCLRRPPLLKKGN